MAFLYFFFLTLFYSLKDRYFSKILLQTLFLKCPYQDLQQYRKKTFFHNDIKLKSLRLYFLFGYWRTPLQSCCKQADITKAWTTLLISNLGLPHPCSPICKSPRQLRERFTIFAEEHQNCGRMRLSVNKQTLICLCLGIRLLFIHRHTDFG